MRKSYLLSLHLIFLILCCVHSQSNLYTLALHSQERGAACIDGSPAGLYYHLGSGANKNKFVIFFDSGGFCNGFTLAQTLEECYQRTFNDLGSTKTLTPTTSLDDKGILSTQKALNPLFYDWTKVYVTYCDGSEHSGTRRQPIAYKDKLLHFRGYNNTMEHFRYLDEEFDFYNGEAIVITGVSAGGIATFLYSNYLMENTKKAKVYAIPDSGLFITEFYSPFAQTELIKVVSENLFKITFEEGIGFPIPECFEQFGEVYHCYNAANLAKYLKAPLFMIQSPYDQFSIDNIVYALCKSNNKPPYSIADCNETAMVAIEAYRAATIAALGKIRGERKDVGAWAPSCVQHGFVDDSSFANKDYQVPSVGGPMVYQAIAEFLENPQQAKMYIDQIPWPYNTGCNGKAAFHLTKQ